MLGKSRVLFSTMSKVHPIPLQRVTAAERTYREELYGARRFTNNNTNSINKGSCPDDSASSNSTMNTANNALNRLNQLMRSEHVMDEVRRRRQFIRPSEQRILDLFKSRQQRFNKLFRNTLGKILNIYESRR